MDTCGTCDELPIVWCSDCGAGLCKNCQTYHRSNRASMNHKTVPFTKYKKLPGFILGIQPFCEEHNELFQMFCKSHNCPCCRKCVIDNHNCCFKLCLEDVLKNVKTSFNSQYLPKLKETSRIISKSLEESESSIQSLREEKQTIENFSERTRQEAIECLNRMHRKLLAELANVDVKICGDMRDLKAKLEKMKTEIDNHISEIYNIQKYASDLQTFMGMKQIQAIASGHSTRLRVLLEEGHFDKSSLSCSISDVINNCSKSQERFGTVNISKEPNELILDLFKNNQEEITDLDINTHEKIPDHYKHNQKVIPKPHEYIHDEIPKPDEYAQEQIRVLEKQNKEDIPELEAHNQENIPKCEEHSQAQVLKPNISLRSIEHISFEFDGVCDVPGSVIVGCCLLPNGKMIFSSEPENGLFVINSSESQDFKIHCEHDLPCGLTAIDHDTVAVALNDNIHLINLNDGSVQRKIAGVGGHVNGITYRNGMILCCVSNKGIMRISLTNGAKVMLVSRPLSHYSYVVTNGENIYYTDYRENSVFCCDMEGTDKRKFKEENILKYPRDITVDCDGYIYVVGDQSKNVIVISPDGKDHAEVLSERNNLQTPWVLHYDITTKNMLVANYDGLALLFHDKQ